MSSRLAAIFVFASIAWTQPGHADELLQAVPETADLTQSSRRKLDDLRKLPSSETVELVRVSVASITSSADLTIALSSRDVLSLQQTALSQTSDSRFIWSGETPSALAMGSGIEGDATIAVNNDKVSASIRTSEGIFRLQPLEDGLHALVKVRQDAFPAEHPDATPPSHQQQDLNRSELRQSGDDTLAEISVLVVASRRAATKIDLQSFAELAVAVSNKSFTSSAVRARFVLAGVSASDYVEAGSHEEDLERLANRSDGQLDKIHELRDTLSADIVVLLNDDTSYCGLARDIFANAANAFATVYWECAVDNLSFPHEVGHLLGACHNPEVNSDCAPFSYGHGYMNPAKRVRTIMSYDCQGGGCTRMPQWARPPEWGNDSTSYDAKVIDQTAVRAARFR